MLRRLGLVAALMVLIASVFFAPRSSSVVLAAPTAAPAPTLIAEVNGPGKGRVWVGAVPAYSAGKPVLVFVHGLHGKATNWWGPTEYYGTNDMYDQAYAAGYRTAFVSLDDEVGGPASSIWNNGYTLNRQLDVILNRYGVSSVNIIAHSKGGVDSNSAIIHYGASPKVQKVVTLSSPHHGSQLADLAYSWWAGWLASLLGQKDDGTYTMQTGYMSYFRSVTDSRSEYNNVRFYTAGGTHHGPWFTAMWSGGAYLPGENDGVVTVINSHHPRQFSRLFTTSLNHDNIRKGSDVWWRISSTISTMWRAAAPTAGLTEEAIVPVTSDEASTTILRGGLVGEIDGALTLPIEGGVANVTFDLVSDRKDLNVTFIDPQGVRYEAAKIVENTETFRGGWNYISEIAKPRSGSWSVEVTGAPEAAYLLSATLQSRLNVTLQRNRNVLAPGTTLDLAVAATSKAGAARSVRVDGLLSGTPTGRELVSDLPTQQNFQTLGLNRAVTTLRTPNANGLYQLGLTVTGVAADGTAFERSFATNIAVMSNPQAIDALPAGR